MKTAVAVAQMTSTHEKQRNLDQCATIIAEAKKQGARFVSLPENFAFFASNKEEQQNNAEGLDGKSLLFLKKLARSHKMWLSLGGFLEKDADKLYNAHLVVSDEGEIAAHYRKIHLFCAALADGSIYDEADSICAGDKLVMATTPFFTAGLSICYDMRFFDLYKAYREQAVQVLLIPAAFTKITGEAHWHVLLRARAIETQSYVLAAAQIGKHNEHRETFGHALIIDPFGKVIAECDNSSHLALAEIDTDYVTQLRAMMPVWHHRRVTTDEWMQTR